MRGTMREVFSAVGAQRLFRFGGPSKSFLALVTQTGFVKPQRPKETPQVFCREAEVRVYLLGKLGFIAPSAAGRTDVDPSQQIWILREIPVAFTDWTHSYYPVSFSVSSACFWHCRLCCVPMQVEHDKGDCCFGVRNSCGIRDTVISFG